MHKNIVSINVIFEDHEDGDIYALSIFMKSVSNPHYYELIQIRRRFSFHNKKNSIK